jgi:uncharacterized membrane protein YphA (DoxX/SURF4 family)
MSQQHATSQYSTFLLECCLGNKTTNLMVDKARVGIHTVDNICCLVNRYGCSYSKGRASVNIVLWIVQALLALAFGMAGAMKLTQPKEKLAGQMPWVEDFAPNTVKAIGALELLGAIGLIVPLALGILPWLTPLAAAGLVLVMLGAMATHLRRRENQILVVNLLLLALAAFIAYGRFVA